MRLKAMFVKVNHLSCWWKTNHTIKCRFQTFWNRIVLEKPNELIMLTPTKWETDVLDSCLTDVMNYFAKAVCWIRPHKTTRPKLKREMLL